MSDNNEALVAGVGLIFNLVVLVFVIVAVAALWKIFVKAGKPGWAAIVPIYNLIVLLQIVGRPVWWIVLYFIPFVNIIIQILVSIDMAKVFGKGPVFGIFLNWLLNPIGVLILGFGGAEYKAPEAKE